MKQEIFSSNQFSRRDSLKRISVGMIGLSTLAGTGTIHASSGFSPQGLKRIAS